MEPDWTTGEAPSPLVRRVPPHNKEAERAVVAACFEAYRGFDELEIALRATDFYDVRLRTIWESMTSLRERRIAIDNLSLKNDLERRGIQVDKQWEDLLLTLEFGTVPTAANLNYYAEVVLALSKKRGLIEAGAKIVELGYSTAKVAEIFNRASEILFSATTDRAVQRIVDGAELAEEVYRHIADPNQNSGVTSGWLALDRIVQSFRPGEMSVLAARPSQGKSSLMLCLASAMLSQGQRIGLCSLEMQRLQLACNTIGSWSSVDTTKIRRGVFGETDPGMFDDDLARMERSRVFDGCDRLTEFAERLAIFDGEAATIADVGRVLERMVQRNRIEFAAIDYMQLMDGSEQTRGRYEEITEVSKGCKRLARRLGIHVMCLAQLNRKAEERRDKKPIMADLRDSGQVEQDADVIMLLHRPEYYYPDKEEYRGLALLDVCKNRNGPTGLVTLNFERAYTRFEPA